MMKKLLIALWCTLPILMLAENNDPPVELGKVKWQRNFQAGLIQASLDEKPIFLLFQEVPGCGTCQRYGQQVLSHPLIVEAIETLFVPVVIYNNKGGADKKVLQYYGEPSWNNPVVRIVNAQKQDLIPRVNGRYTPQAVVQAMVHALTVARQPIPNYLQLLDEELSSQSNGAETAYLSMYCFWTGEKELGQINGVIATQPGFMHNQEVVQVTYDPDRIGLAELIQQAAKAQCADQVFADTPALLKTAGQVKEKSALRKTGKFRLDGEPKYYLSQTVYQHLPMTSLQAVKANSMVGQQKDPEVYLSPRQIALVKKIRQEPNKPWPNLINVDLDQAWRKIEQLK